MIDDVRAEVLKTFSLRLWWIMLLIGAVLVTLTALPFLLLSGFAADEGIDAMDLTQPAAVQALLSSIAGASVVALLIGVLSVTGEYRHGTVTDTFLTEPRRWRVVAAKCVVAAAMGVLLALVTAVTILVLATTLMPEPHAPIEPATVAGITAGAAVVYALYAILGVALGAIITNQLAAVLVGILWMLVIENLIGGLLPRVAPWLPGGAAQAVLGTPGSAAPWMGVLILLAYAVALVAVAATTTLRRDIT